MARNAAPIERTTRGLEILARAGAVLAACRDPSVPWHRVVRADGSLAQGARQRRLLEAEGVPFQRSRVDMAEAHLPGEALESGNS